MEPSQGRKVGFIDLGPANPENISGMHHNVVITGSSAGNLGVHPKIWNDLGKDYELKHKGYHEAYVASMAGKKGPFFGSAQYDEQKNYSYAATWTTRKSDISVLSNTPENVVHTETWSASRSGNVIVGLYRTQNEIANKQGTPFAYSNGQFFSLPVFPGSQWTVATDVSDDGKRIVGAILDHNHPKISTGGGYWTYDPLTGASSDFITLSTPSTGLFTINGDGSIFGGADSRNQAALWSGLGYSTVTSIPFAPTLPGDTKSRVLSVNKDSTSNDINHVVAVGESAPKIGDKDIHAFRYGLDPKTNRNFPGTLGIKTWLENNNALGSNQYLGDISFKKGLGVNSDGDIVSGELFNHNGFIASIETLHNEKSDPHERNDNRPLPGPLRGRN